MTKWRFVKGAEPYKLCCVFDVITTSVGDGPLNVPLKSFCYSPHFIPGGAFIIGNFTYEKDDRKTVLEKYEWDNLRKSCQGCFELTKLSFK